MSSVTRLLVIAVLLCASCGVGAKTGSPAASPWAAASATGQGVSSARERAPLPRGFPVMPGARRVAVAEDDPGLIARWTSDKLGSAAYDFYVEALPASGFPIVGLYPGGEVAVIRFRVPDGAIWQMVARGGAAGIATIEVRLDRP